MSEGKVGVDFERVGCLSCRGRGRVRGVIETGSGLGGGGTRTMIECRYCVEGVSTKWMNAYYAEYCKDETGTPLPPKDLLEAHWNVLELPADGEGDVEEIRGKGMRGEERKSAPVETLSV